MEAMIDPTSVVQAFHSSRHAFLPDSSKPLFVIGKNDAAEKVAMTRAVTGLIDDFSADEAWEGIRIVKSADLPPGSQVVNCSTSISPVTVHNRMGSLPGVDCIPFADLCRNPSAGIELPQFVLEAREDLTRNRTYFERVFARLKDDASRAIFNQLMSYRLTADYRFMSGFSVRLRDQYFEDFIPNRDGITFADCGGYDGDTTEQFVARYPGYANVFLFEPSPRNLAKAKRRLEGHRNIEFLPLGLSDSVGTLFFDPDAGSASAVSRSGSTRIDVTTLDTAIDEPLTFIKMDLEGWELKALIGAEDHLRRDRPILAIAVYHAISDMWKIPEYVLSMSDGYDLYLRHYTEGWSETVMYFIPDGS